MSFTADNELLRCDIALNVDFSMLKGYYTVTPGSGKTVTNSDYVVTWGSQVHAQAEGKHFLAAGTLYNIVDPGMEGNSAASVYTTSKTIHLKQAAVTHTNTIRIEVSQPAGTELQLDLGSSFEVYGTLSSSVSVLRTVTAPTRV